MSTSEGMANIGPRERRRRRLTGFVALGAAGALAGAATVLGWGTLARWAVAPLLLVGFLGLIQARDRTCVRLAAGGFCNLDDGVEAIKEPQARAAVRSQATRVLLKSLAATAAAMALVLALP